MNGPSSTSATLAPGLPGRTVGHGRFEVLGELGRGGMGEVYLAREQRSRRELALKVIAARYVGRPEREQRFRNEAEYARRVGAHEHVVSVEEVGTLADCDGRLFMTMTRIEGPTLAMELAMQQQLTVGCAVRWARQVAAGLAAIHAAGIVHRDLSPSNILIDRGTGAAKIFDFGLASEMDAPSAPSLGRITRLGEVPGTHGYMSPEQVSRGAPSGAMDVYAFGAVLTEMLVGHNPFAHFDREEFIQWQQTSREETPSIRRWGLSLPDALAELIDDCLRRNPAQRPRDGSELLARLGSLMPTPVVALVPVLPVPTPPLDEPGDDDSTIEACIVHTRSGVHPRRAVLRVAAGFLVLLLGVAIGRCSVPKVPAHVVARPAVVAEPRAAVVETPPMAPMEMSRSADDFDLVENNTGSPPSIVPQEFGRGSELPRRADPPPTCKVRRARAHDAAVRGDWSAVLGFTKNRRCWPRPLERARLRVRALSEVGQYVACLELATGSEDPEVDEWRAQCERGLWTPRP